MCYTIADVHYPLATELIGNAFFVQCTLVFRKLMGLAIVGCTSAQGASLAVLDRERSLSRDQLLLITSHRDNYLTLVLRQKQDVTSPEARPRKVMECNMQVVGMKLRTEKMGGSIPFHGSQLMFDHQCLPNLKPSSKNSPMAWLHPLNAAYA